MLKRTGSVKHFPSSQLGVGCADITARERRYVQDVLRTTRLSYGPYSQKFEKLFSQVHDCRFAVFCNSGTSALQAAVACLKELEGWKDDDEIIVPALTFIATSNVVIQNKMKPVFVDADPLTYNIAPEKIGPKITSKTRAIIPAHLFGLPCDMDPILDLAKKHHLKVIEDSCETMFVSYKGRKVGSMGDISCFSTYMAHFIVTGVGGLAVTSNPDYAVVLKSLMNHGRDSIYLSIDDDKNLSGDALFQVVDKRFRFVRVGYSYRCTEMEAALGLAQLERRDKILAARQNNARTLVEKLKPLSGHLQLPTIPPGFEHAFMMFPIVVKSERFKKKDLVHFLEENQVETRDMFPLINQPIYLKLFGDLRKDYPAAIFINENGFFIGCHQKLSRQDLDYIVDRFFEFFKD